jgi:hypothetical protein
MKYTAESATQILMTKSNCKIAEDGFISVKKGSMKSKSACAAYDYLRYKAPNHPLVLLTN